MWSIESSGRITSAHYWVCNESSCDELGSAGTYVSTRAEASSHARKAGHPVRISTVQTEVLKVISTKIPES